MNGALQGLAHDYASVLRAYLTDEDETCLHRMYELGRRALNAECGILQMAELHQKALSVVLRQVTAEDRERVLRLGQTLFLEVLSPFEMSQRQCRDASVALRCLNETLEAEVHRIALALHDEAAQLLVSVDLAVDEVAFGLPAHVRDRLEKIRAPLRQCASELRRLSHELRPPVLDDLGLMPALEFLADGVSNRIGIPIAVSGSTEGRPPGAVEVAVYRIVQEALSNVAKHAHASKVVVEVRQSESVLHCTVRDNGTGFDVAALGAKRAQRGLGLIAIRERIDALGGTHRLVTAPGEGTELLLSVPLGGTDGDSRSAR
ncbi:MAG: ATP-binding protein [Acidobacteria bacterium]|nr:ATP-binding protein [Acidobacteriota bacterium]